MAAVKFEKGSEEWTMFQQYYILIQKYYIPDDTDKYWEDVIAEMGEFIKKYEKVPLARKIAMGFLDTMESELKKKKGVMT